MKWFIKCLRQYADFSGRARRREYWYFILFFAIFFYIVAGIAFGVAIISDSPSAVFVALCILWLVGLAFVVPSWAVIVRRLHDTGKSGWFCLIYLIPIVGFIWMLVVGCTDSQPGTNKWGKDPKGREDGLTEGRKGMQIETAKAMKTKGIDADTICECTGLSIEEIREL